MQDGDMITLTDEEGNAFQMEVVGEVEYGEDTYVVFLPMDIDEDDEDYGFVILKSVEVDGEENFDTVEDEELLEKVYAIYMEEVFNGEEEDEEE